MKKILLISIFLILTLTIYSKSDIANVWDSAVSKYSVADYNGALNRFKSLESEGYNSKELNYNIGNCYFKLKEYGYAVLYFERALKFDPSDKDIISNLELVREFTIDKIDVLPEFILNTWISDLNYSLSSSMWSLFVLVFTISLALLIILFRNLQKHSLKKLTFALSIVSFVLMIISFYFSVKQISDFNTNNFGVVINSVVSVKSSPDQSAKDLLILHEGTKVKINDTLSGWKRVELSDGREGWLKQTELEVI